jgi:hypothetical protein
MLPGLRLQASYTARSREFPGQRGHDQTVAINLGFAD